MKKLSSLCMLSGLCLGLAGCEVRREGAQVTFVNGTHYTHISIGGLIFEILLAAFLNGSDLIGCDDTVDIKYLKTRPTIIHVARDN